MARSFYSTTYSTQYTPKKPLNPDAVQSIAYETGKPLNESSPNSSPHSLYYDWKDKRGTSRYNSATRDMQEESAYRPNPGSQNWMPSNRLNNETAYVVSQIQNVPIGTSKINHYQTTTQSDYIKPVTPDYLNGPISKTPQQQSTSYTINNICTAGLENHDLHLYDGTIDEHARKQMEKYNAARSGTAGAIGENAYVRSGHWHGAQGITGSHKDTEYGNRYRANGSDSVEAYQAAVAAGSASPVHEGTPICNADGSIRLSGTGNAQSSGFTNHEDSLPLGGTRTYITEQRDQFRDTESERRRDVGIALSGTTSGFVNGHDMRGLLRGDHLGVETGNVVNASEGGGAEHLARVQQWRKGRLGA